MAWGHLLFVNRIFRCPPSGVKPTRELGRTQGGVQCRVPIPPIRRSSGPRRCASREAAIDSIPALAADLGVSSEALRHWLRQDDADAGRGQPGDLTPDERDELRRLRREVNVRQQEREILRKAAACCAQETL